MTKVNSYVNVVTDQIKQESIFHHIYLYASRREKIAQMVEIDPTLYGYVYDNAVFEDKNHISLYEKAKYLSQGNRVLAQLEEVQLEISAVLDNNGSTFWQDFFSK